MGCGPLICPVLYLAIQQLSPYDVPVQKEECINHVSKRLGTRLRKLKKEMTTTVTSKTGKEMKKNVLGGAGQLTDNVINKLTRYFGKANRGNKDKPNTSTHEIRKNILASYFHASSTYDIPIHKHYPPGVNLWCFYKRGESDKTKPCRRHSDKPPYLSKIPYEHRQAIMKVYMDLTTEELLKRCMKSRTQNSNESIHSKLLMKVAKHKFGGLRRVNFVPQVVVMEHNFGYEASYFPSLLGFNTTLSKSVNLKSLQDECRRSNTTKTSRHSKKGQEYTRERF
ncbi:hypothetical protein Pcinc_011006 [Petrolisthes cinctipes]|uniref:Mutator-like transposase domain-containing protein n=1 Tax=Petrolisthes cinctipes TaxID=88211 RepID=A0AAE1G1U7_PETCI|nr:hypothetical protein Pcinc_011006 [Petrolisthes cinctipes]